MTVDVIAINGKCYAVVKVNVRNVINLVKGGWIKDTLIELGVPGYLARTIESYFSGKFLWYKMDDGARRIRYDSRCSPRLSIGAHTMEDTL